MQQGERFYHLWQAGQELPEVGEASCGVAESAWASGVFDAFSKGRSACPASAPGLLQWMVSSPGPSSPFSSLWPVLHLELALLLPSSIACRLQHGISPGLPERAWQEKWCRGENKVSVFWKFILHWFEWIKSLHESFLIEIIVCYLQLQEYPLWINRDVC